ncbi:serine hydrolase [Brevundimonas sp.]|uniref:serine hydrolase n=1 Tax=Brevundimonas sp. TaxID=1871086 RepID=UPI003D6D3201
MSIRLSRRAALISSAAVSAGSALPATGWAQTASDTRSDEEIVAAVDAWVKKAMAGFPDQPAVSVGVVRGGKPILTRGYGVRKKGEARRVDEHTLFAVASNTKAMTAAALAILVDEGKVKWDEPVKTYLPGFTLSDPVIGERITVRDTLSHRAGFGLGAGDLLFWPNSDRTREQVMAAVPFVPIEDGFRANYHYCNLMFVVAGEVLAKVSGMAWEDFIQTRILDRLGMSETVPLARLADPAKSALPHGRVGPPLRYQGAMTVLAEDIASVWNWDSAAAAGGVCTTPVDWAKWISVQLNGGLLPDGTRLFSEAAGREMWKPNIIVSSSAGPTGALPGRAIASTYALGWQVQDYRGERMVTHGGGAPGFISGTVLLPGRKTGFSVFTNAEESLLLRALRSGIADILMNKADFDWVADGVKTQGENNAKSVAAAVEINAKQAAGAAPSMPLDAYVGTWRDPWYGDIVIEQKTEGRGRNRKSGLWLAFAHTPALKGWLEPYDGETFRTRFPDKREEDAFITFSIATAKPATATVKGVSPDIDFSYDYQDLRLTRV